MRKRQGQLVGEAGVVVLNRTDCCPGDPRCGSTTVLGVRARHRLANFGLVRFLDPEGHLQRWESEDGTVLAPLLVDVSRPALP